MRQLLQVTELIRARLPPERADALAAEARRSTARAAIRRSVRLARSGERAAAFAQLRWSVRADRSPSTLARAALGLARVAVAGRRS